MRVGDARNKKVCPFSSAVLYTYEEGLDEGVNPEATGGVLARVQAVHGHDEAAERPVRDRVVAAEELGEGVLVEGAIAVVEIRHRADRRRGDRELHVRVVDVKSAFGARLGAPAAGHDV